MIIYALLLAGAITLGEALNSTLVSVAAWLIGCALAVLVREQGRITRATLREIQRELRRISK